MRAYYKITKLKLTLHHRDIIIIIIIIIIDEYLWFSRWRRFVSIMVMYMAKP